MAAEVDDMPTVRIRILLIGLLLVMSASTFAQKSSLVITGSVTDFKPITHSAKRNGIYEKLEPYIEIRLRLVYHNRGETTLIVPKPNSLYDGKKLYFYEIPSSDSKVSATADEWMYPAWMYPGSSDRQISNLLKELARPEPSGYYFTIIEPGGFYETMETIRAISGYKIEKRPSGEKFPSEIEIAIPEHPYFKIRYSLSIKDRPESIEPLADAQRRWKEFGKLFLNSDGDFFFETGVIINKLPD